MHCSGAVLTLVLAHLTQGKSVHVSPLTEAGGLQLMLPQHTLNKCKEEETLRQHKRGHSFSFKNLAGPPGEFGAMAQPTPEATSAYSGHYSTPFTLKETELVGLLSQTIDVNVDSPTGFAIASFVTDVAATYSLVGPDGKDVPLAPHAVKVSSIPQLLPVFSKRNRALSISAFPLTRF
jgi:hypothetical protein